MLRQVGSFSLDSLQREIQNQRDGTSTIYDRPEGEEQTPLETAAGVVSTIDGLEQKLSGGLTPEQRSSGSFTIQLPPGRVKYDLSGIGTFDGSPTSLSVGVVDGQVDRASGTITDFHRSMEQSDLQPDPNFKSVLWPPSAAFQSIFSSHDIRVTEHSELDHFTDKSGREHYVSSSALFEGQRPGSLDFTTTEIVVDRLGRSIAVFEGEEPDQALA